MSCCARPGPAVQRVGKPRQLLIGPGGGNAEAGMNQHKRRAASRPGTVRAARSARRGRSPAPACLAGRTAHRNRATAARRCNCSGASGPPKSSFNPSSVVAALPLPPAQTRRQRNVLLELQPHAVLDSCRLQKHRRGAIDQVARVRRQAGRAAAQLNPLPRPREAQPVEHPDRLEHRFQLVKTIRAACRECSAAG